MGRYAFGLTAIGFGICAFVSHEAFNWHYIVAAVEILGGLALAWPRSARAGALALCAVYAIFALVAVPPIVRHPLVYNSWGNFFEQLSFVCGAAILYTQTSRISKIAYYAFGVCVVSFGLEQLFYLSETASLVPKWIPPGQMFWAWATTIAFFLAAISLLTGVRAQLGARSLAAMVAGFALLVWVPALIGNPHVLFSWTEMIETVGIAAMAWIVADLVASRNLSP